MLRKDICYFIFWNGFDVETSAKAISSNFCLTNASRCGNRNGRLAILGENNCSRKRKIRKNFHEWKKHTCFFFVSFTIYFGYSYSGTRMTLLNYAMSHIITSRLDCSFLLERWTLSYSTVCLSPSKYLHYTFIPDVTPWLSELNYRTDNLSKLLFTCASERYENKMHLACIFLNRGQSFNKLT